MKRVRVKAIAMGLALAAGSALAADGEWRPLGQNVSGAAAKAKAETPVWLPPPQSAKRDIVPASNVGELSNVPALLGPRATANDTFGPLPVIPALPGVPNNALPSLPPMTAEPPRAMPDRGATPPNPVPVPIPEPLPKEPLPKEPPAPKTVEPPTMVPPREPGILPRPKSETDPAPLPFPRPQPQPAPQPELPTAPPELMYPAGGIERGKHGVFGSPSLSISRDYPPLRDVVHQHSRELVLSGESGDPLNRLSVRGEYLLWWMPGFPTPVLGTTNANTNLNGYLGEPGTASLLGPGSLIDSTRHGLRLRAGYWLDDCGSCGFDIGGFFLGKRDFTATFGSDVNPLITRPVFVPNLIPNTNQPLGENGEAVAVPGILRGALTIRADSSLWGLDVNAHKNVWNDCGERLEFFGGYRHLNLRESLTFTENITVIGPGGNRLAITDPIGTQVVVQDRFATRNAFHGAQVGAVYERRWGQWDFDARASLALGTTHQTLEISGFQLRQRPDAELMTFRGGLLAAGPNLGRFTRDRFSVVPELTMNVGYWLSPNFRVFAGYNFMYWTNVIRPGDQLDRVVDLTFVPNALNASFSGQYRPRPLFKQRDLAVNGLQLGLDWRW
jgi:hypothetical protein